MTANRRRTVASLANLLGCALLAGTAWAQDAYPSRPITLLVPFPPGGSADVVIRPVAAKVAEALKQPIVIDNRSGGGGNIAAQVTKQAAPDGYTLFLTNMGVMSVNPMLSPELNIDPVKDFQPITPIISFPHILVVPPDSPVKTVADLASLAKTKPGGLSFASQGTGSGGHLLGEMFKLRTGANMVHVPYRGAAPAAIDLSAGRVDFFFVSYSSLLPFLQGGKVRAIAVTSPQRLPVLPDAPTMTEAGFAGIALDVWFGLVAPAGTPDAVIDKLNAAFVRAVRDPDVVKQMTQQGAEPVATTPAEFAAFIASETERFGKVVRAVGAKAE